MITTKEVINLITKKLPSSQVFVENIKGNDHLQVTVLSSEFDGLSLVKQHQLVYSALKEELASEAMPGIKQEHKLIMDKLTSKIKNLIDANPVMVFMKEPN